MPLVIVMYILQQKIIFTISQKKAGMENSYNVIIQNSYIKKYNLENLVWWFKVVALCIIDQSLSLTEFHILNY